MTSKSADPHAITRRITTISVIVAVVMIVIKAFALGASGSVSILASLTDSVLDLVASVATFVAVRWAAAAPDHEHRYGHGKAEGLAALVQSGIVMASSVFIGIEAVRRIFRPEPVTGGAWAIGVVLVAMALTGWLIWQQNKAVKATGSLAVAGDRAHYAADLGANAVVLIGVVSGSLLNAPGLDAVAGLIVAVWLGWGAIGLLRDAGNHLMDAAAPDEDRNAVITAVLEDERLSNVHQLRTRMAGQVLMVQMHVDVDPDLSLAQAHAIVDAAEKRVLALYPRADIIIHADPAHRAQPSEPASSAPPTEPQQNASKGPWNF